MKIIVTVIPTDIVSNSLLYYYFFFLANQKQESGFQQVGGLVTRNIFGFVYSDSRSPSKPCRIQ